MELGAFSRSRCCAAANACLVLSQRLQNDKNTRRRLDGRLLLQQGLLWIFLVFVHIVSLLFSWALSAD